jgi:hypothetical protein
MTKKLLPIILLAATLFAAPAARAQHGKSELTLGYGYLSIYQFANKTPFNTSSGTIALGYKYYLSDAVTLGMGIGYENISNWAICRRIRSQTLGLSAHPYRHALGP